MKKPVPTVNKKPSKDRNPEGYKPKPTAYEKNSSTIEL